MTDANPDVLVLRGKAHGISSRKYGDVLQDRLPEYDVRTARTPQEERELIRNAHVVTGIDIDEELLAVAEALEYFACAAAGTDHLPTNELAEQGVAVTNAAGVHGPNIAEHVIGCMLLFARRLDRGMRQQRRHEWRQYQAFGELEGSTVTVVGLGAIGTAVAERLEAFNVETVGVRYTPSKGGPTDEVVGFEPSVIQDVFARTDYLVVACPLTDTTRRLVDDEVFQTLPPHAVLVNVGRGPVVDTDALLEALRGNKIHAAAIDVTDPEPLPKDHPLWTFENLLITPHVSGHTDEYWTRTADIVVKNLQRIEETGNYRNLDNLILTPAE